MIKRIHVNQHHIKHNAKHGDKDNVWIQAPKLLQKIKKRKSLDKRKLFW